MAILGNTSKYFEIQRNIKTTIFSLCAGNNKAEILYKITVLLYGFFVLVFVRIFRKSSRIFSGFRISPAFPDLVPLPAIYHNLSQLFHNFNRIPARCRHWKNTVLYFENILRIFWEDFLIISVVYPLSVGVPPFSLKT